MERDHAVLDGYVRVSRVAGRAGDSYISPSVQRDAIQRWADYKNVTIGEWHVDEDWSGGTHQRPGLERAVARALAGDTSGIISWKIDRFSRTTEGGLRDLRRLQQANARLAFVVEDIDTGTVYGRMIYTILLAVSEAFLENIKASWAITKSRAVARGAYISRTPWGYQRNDDGTLSPHPKRAVIVLEAFRRAAAGSIQEAMSYLRNVAPERDWTTTKTRRLLSQRSYLGETRNGELVQAGTHEPLVSRAIWEAAQSTPTIRRAGEQFPLSGLACCESCGAAMIGGRGGKGQRVYRCSNRCDQAPVITATILEDHVRDRASRMLSGIEAGVGDPEADTLTLLERAVADAESELDAFAADLALRRALGDRYHVHLQTRVGAVEHARAEYREQARRAQSSLTLDTPGVLDDPELAGVALRSIFASILVTRGRGLSVSERVRFVPFDVDGPSGMPGSEDP